MNDTPSSKEERDARLQEEIVSALGDMSVEDLMGLDTKDTASPPQRSFQTGTVVDVHGSDVLVEFGPRTQGVCPLDQFEEPPQINTRLQFIIEGSSSQDGLLTLTREGAVQKARWDALGSGQVIEARCTGTNKGGLEMEVAGRPAFMPAGQVDLRHVEDLTVFVGEKFRCEVIEIDHARHRLILSRRACLQSEQEQSREKLLETLEEGQILDAVISSICDFGAFADLGGMDGLIHISEISHERITHPGEQLKNGQQVRVQVLQVDRAHVPPRVGLSMKQVMADPMADTMASFTEGSQVTGCVTRLVDFGAFVELAPGVEGLLHISEMSRDHVRTPSDVVKENEIITVQVLSVDPGSQRIGLSLKALPEHGPSPTDEEDMERSLASLREKFDGKLKGGLE